MFDTHSHLDGEEFHDDIDEVVARAREAGVEKIFIPNINETTVEPVRSLCQSYPDFCYPMIGLHPEDVDPTKRDVCSVLRQMEELLVEPHPFIAIGEIGLDFYWDETYRDLQLRVFEQQVEWGSRFHLPLMIHARSAHRELVEVMNRHRSENLSGVFHCFTGTEEEATELLTFPNFMLGIGGVVTFKKSKLPDVLKHAVPLSRVVLETDAPYMAPVPFRGKRNESAYVAEVAKRLSEIYDLPVSEVERQTNSNVQRIFPNAFHI